jgi:hypothetical protein
MLFMNIVSPYMLKVQAMIHGGIKILIVAFLPIASGIVKKTNPQANP